MESIHSILKAIQGSAQKSVLATIIHVEGSAYLKEGTVMLFQEDGTRIGMLSAGCLEDDLALRAVNVLNKREAETFTYDMKAEDDLTWGQGAGCRGVLYILLEPVDEKLKKYLGVVKEFLDSGIPVQHVKELTNDFKQTGYGFFTATGQTFGNIDEHQIKMPENKRASGIQLVGDALMCTYFHLYRPKPRLIVFGAGPDARPLVSFAAEIGFSVTVCDWRPAFCREEYFSSADKLTVGFPEDIVPKLELNSDDYVVIMTHHFQRDQEILSLLKNRPLRYAGILGPRKRTTRLLQTEEIPEWLHSPVGLPIGARGPQEIAISIAGELIQEAAKMKG